MIPWVGRTVAVKWCSVIYALFLLLVAFYGEVLVDWSFHKCQTEDTVSEAEVDWDLITETTVRAGECDTGSPLDE